MKRKPRITAKIARGLEHIANLANADCQADQERYPEDHAVWDALEWIRRTLAVLGERETPR